MLGEVPSKGVFYAVQTGRNHRLAVAAMNQQAVVGADSAHRSEGQSDEEGLHGARILRRHRYNKAARRFCEGQRVVSLYSRCAGQGA